jgi:hypothetical protein
MKPGFVIGRSCKVWNSAISMEKVGFQLLSVHQLKLLICFIIMATAAEQAESTRRPG